MGKILLVLVAWLWGGVASAAPSVLVLGDSLSAGYGLSLNTGWVHLLEQRVTEMGLPHQIINASVSGETSAGGLSRLPALLERHRPAVVIIELGGNDGLRGLPLDLLESNLATAITTARDAGSAVVLVGMQLPPNYGPAYTRRFAAIYPRLAQSAGVALVPFLLAGVAGDPQLMQADGIHAAAAAQPQLLANVWPQLQPLLEEKRAAASTTE